MKAVPLLLLPLLLHPVLLVGRRADACTCPSMTRDAIIDLAKTGVGSPYVWGGTCWDPANRKSKGADCSGYVTKCWQIPQTSAVTDCTPHYYTTATFSSQTTHWNKISRSELQRGDALVYRSSGSGHIILFESQDSDPGTSGCYVVYEARGSAYGIVHRVKCPDAAYVAIRRHGLVDAPAPTPTNHPPTGKVDGADCQTIRGWAQDPDAKTTAVSVKITVDGTPGQSGVTSYTVKANQSRQDLCASLGSCEHGFSFTVPAKLKDGKAHTLRAYAVDAAGGTNPELDGSPRQLTCDPPTTSTGPDPIEPDPIETGTGDEVFEQTPDPQDPDTILGGCALASTDGPNDASAPAAALLTLLALLLLRPRSRRR